MVIFLDKWIIQSNQLFSVWRTYAELHMCAQQDINVIRCLDNRWGEWDEDNFN